MSKDTPDKEKMFLALLLVTRHARNVEFSVSPNVLRAEAVMAEMLVEKTLGKKQAEKLFEKAFKQSYL